MKKKVFYSATAALAACLLGPNALVNLIFLFWVLSALVLFTSQKSWSIDNLKQPISLGFIGIFAALAIGLIWSTHRQEGGFLLERSLMFVLFPLTLSGLSRPEDQKQTLRHAEWGLVFGTSLVLLIGVLFAFYDTCDFALNSKAEIRGWYRILLRARLNFTYWGFTEPLNLHAAYFGYYLVFVFFIVANRMNHTKLKRREKKWLKRLLIWVAVFIVLMKSTSPAFSWAIGLVLFLNWNKSVVEKIKTPATLGGFLSVIVLSILLYKFEILFSSYKVIWWLGLAWVVGFFGMKLFQKAPILRPSATLFGIILTISILTIFLSFRSFSPQGNEHSANGERAYTWRGAALAISGQPLLGAGTGGAFSEVQKVFAEIGFEKGIDAEYNEHNQYFRYWLEAGLLGLAAIITLLIFGYRIALKAQYFPFAILIIGLSIFCFTESCLVRRHFISLCSFFLPLYGLYFAKHTSEDYNATT